MTPASIMTTLTRLVVPIALLLLLYAVDQRAEERGMQKAQAQHSAAAVQRLEFSIERSGQLAGQLGQLLDRNQLEKADAKIAFDRLDSDLRSGALRLSVRATTQPGGNHSAATGPVQARADIDPADAAALVRITEDGDNAIRDLNTCIDGYAKVMRQANGAQP
ncbi:lysis system i-spanin subunit Rz [Comamonas sp.]|uniref:lysis system i-spanin subunit Rz n=1 Tax=Comamonas sp. TaxID=34028 RepID=UPI00264825D9|nr:lysis system i-spanin subunit Rz [Comamonas sp.]MDN5535639.1 lysis protein [Comamonas sp.]